MPKGKIEERVMPIFISKKVFTKHPCMTECEATNRTVIRDEV
jgi:hypothetical protein